MTIKSTILAATITGMALALATPTYAETYTNSGRNYSDCKNQDGKQGFKGGKHHKRGHRKGGMGPNPEIIKERLNLAEGQLPAWQVWNDAVEAQKAVRDQRREEMQAKRQSGERPDPQTMGDQRIAHMEENLAQMKIINQAFKDFYQTLTAEQQETLKNLRPKQRGKGKGGNFQQRGPQTEAQ